MNGKMSGIRSIGEMAYTIEAANKAFGVDLALPGGSRVDGGVERSGLHQPGGALFLLDRQALSFPHEAKGKIPGENQARGNEVDR